MESSSSSCSSHRSTTTATTSELFICFSSRNSPMKTSSILSPGRARDTPTSLSGSVSRRLRSSGSIKNGQASPMFPTGNKKRGSGFENPEPSSPKVTCIGQVRVKTKKQGKKMRNMSRREMSFRKTEGQIQRQSSVNSVHFQQDCSSHRNQRWVHLPLTICETLRGFGSEFSCLFPCKSSCFSGERDGRDGRESGRSCVDVFAKWLVAVEDESRERGGERRDIELVVEEDDEEEGDCEGKVVKRRHVFDGIEIKDYDDERGRVSICIPPKNALLLMRCRSDPVKMEALASRFWEPQLPAEDEEEEAVFNDGEEKNVKMEVFKERRASVSGNIFDEIEESKVEQVENIEIEHEDMKLEVEVLDNEVICEKEVEMEVFEERRASVSGNIFDEVEKSKGKQVEKIEVEQEVDMKMELEVLNHEVRVEDLIVSEQRKILEEDLHVSEEALDGEQEAALEDLESDKEAQVSEQEETEDNKSLVEENESSFVTALEVFVNQETDQGVEEENRISCCDSYDELEETKHIRCILLDESDDEVSKPEPKEQEQEPALGYQAKDSTDDAEEADKETQQANQTQTLQAQLQFEQEQSIHANYTQDHAQDDEVQSNAPLETEGEMLAKKESEALKLQKLPDCLLLMMCEPKLSMEVSKETWVCSTDFIRWRPQKKKLHASHAPPCKFKKCSSPGREEHATEKRKSVDSKYDDNVNPFVALPPLYPVTQTQPPLQPGRASCCLPAAGGVSMATMIEQKLVDAVAYEPFVLTRCKSEPMRTASKLAQGACFWKNRAIEPHRRATYGAAGVGC